MRRAENWQELGDRIFRRRYESLDLNIGLILGGAGAMVIDSRATHGQADELLADLRSITTLPITHLINSHHHWDHTFGNARFSDAEIVGHVRCQTTLVERGEEMRRTLIEADWIPVEAKPHFESVEITPPTTTFDDVSTVDLGDRSIELRHLGLGHTDNDILIRADDVLFAGDLVEEGGPPQFGDAFPGEWLRTLDRLISTAPRTIVPGHGDVVNTDFVAAQRDQIARAIDGQAVFPDPIMDQLRRRLHA